jgi:plastocyanin
MLLRVPGSRSSLAVACCLLSVFAVGLFGRLAPSVVAQEEQPAPGEAAVAYLPAADALGPGWKRFEPTAVPNLAADTFREGAAVNYGGPEGARVMLFAILVDEGRVRRGWEEATAIYENVRYNVYYDYEVEEQLRNVPPPPGCAEAKRIEGKTYFDGFDVGVTLCAADPDLILLAVASGRVNDEIGFAAADNAIDAALEAGGISTEPPADDGEETAVVELEAYDVGWRTADQPGPQVSLSVAPGTTIQVVNAGSAQHHLSIEALGLSTNLDPGQTVDVVVPADAVLGIYEFVCDIPGHAAAGMTGELVVE